MHTGDDLYELALRAVTTPRVDAYETSVVLQDLILERGLASDIEGARTWIANEVEPKLIAEEGRWDVEITGTEIRHAAHRGPRRVVWFRREGQTRVNAYVVSRYDSDILPVLAAGRGHLETKRIRTKDERTFMLHKWATF